MTVTLRPFDETTDYPRLVEIANTWNDEPTSEAQERKQYNERVPGSEGRYQVALRDGKAVGFGFTTWTPWDKAGEYRLWLCVDPAYRGGGVGSALYQDSLTWAREKDAFHLKAIVRDDDPYSNAFTARRGFIVESHSFRSALDFAAFDEAPFVGAISANEAAGIRFVNLAEVGLDEENQRKLYDLNVMVSRDEPTSQGYFPSFEQFFQTIFTAPWYLPNGQTAALDGDRWIGIAAVGRFPDGERSFNAFTGVHPEYRGRQIALALKLHAIRLSQQIGVPGMWTNNDSRNAPMLAINRKLGFVPERGLYRIRLDLK